MGGTIDTVENAVIRLYENDIFKQTAFYQDSGWYNTLYIPKAGKRYRIEVEVPGFEMVTAESSVPINPVIDAFTCKLFEGIDPEDWGFRNSETRLTFQDDANTSNFYELTFFNIQSGTRINAQMVGARLDVTDLAIKTDGDLDFNPQQFYFSDQSFNGTSKTILLNWFGLLVNNPVTGQQEELVFNADFKSLSPEYFNFRKSWTKHVFNQNTNLHYDDPVTLLFLGDPVVMYSNVSGGYGVFAGYNPQVKEVTYVQ